MCSITFCGNTRRVHCKHEHRALTKHKTVEHVDTILTAVASDMVQHLFLRLLTINKGVLFNTEAWYTAWSPPLVFRLPKLKHELTDYMQDVVAFS